MLHFFIFQIGNCLTANIKNGNAHYNTEKSVFPLQGSCGVDFFQQSPCWYVKDDGSSLIEKKDCYRFQRLFLKADVQFSAQLQNPINNVLNNFLTFIPPVLSILKDILHSHFSEWVQQAGKVALY